MEEIIQLILKTYGVLGIFLLLPLGASYLLWKENKALTKQLQTNHEDAAKKIQECNDRIIEAHKARVVDGQAINNKLVDMVSEQSSLNKETILALDKLGGMVEKIQTEGSSHGSTGRR